MSDMNNEMIKKCLCGGILCAILGASVLLYCDYINALSLICLGSIKVMKIAFIFVVVALLIVAVKNEWSKLYTTEFPSIIEIVNISGLSLCGLYYCGASYLCMISSRKTIMIVSFAVVLVLSSIKRLVVLYSIRKKCEQNDNNRVFQLDEIISGEIVVSSCDGILVSDRPSKTDLLARTNIINNIIDAVGANKSQNSFCVGLVGAWGCGKTTLANFALNHLEQVGDYYVVRDFELWKYGSQKSIVAAMYSKLLNVTGMSYTSYQIKEIIDTAYEITSDTKAGSISKLVYSNLYRGTDVIEKTKKQIGSYLARENKSVVFLIDDIDRSDAINIVFLLRLLGSSLNISRVTFLLLYENDRLNDLLCNQEGISRKYIEKIVQKEIYVPSISDERLCDICSAFFDSIKKLFDIEMTKDHLNTISNIVASQVSNIRELIRVLNTIVPNITNNINYLDKRDLLVLELIRMSNPVLYDSIRKNRKYFVSSDLSEFEDTYSTVFKKKDASNECKSFFNELFSVQENKDYIELLSLVFPYVDRYRKNRDIIQEYSDPALYSDVTSRRAVCSARYFDLYFNYGVNWHLMIAKLSDDFISAVNNLADYSSINELVQGFFNQENYDNHRAILERINILKKKIKDKQYKWMLMALAENYRVLSVETGFLVVSARDRVFYMIESYLETCDIKDATSIVDYISEMKMPLIILRDLFYYAKNHWTDTSLNDRFIILKSAYYDACKKVIDEQDAYSEIYERRITICLRDYYTEHDDIDGMRSYILEHINENSVFKMLCDVIGCSISTNYKYYIEKNLFDDLFSGFELVDKHINLKQNMTETEQFILEIYHEYKQAVLNDKLEDYKYDGVKCIKDKDYVFQF